MTNRERILKGLKCCANGCLADCPYFKTDECGQLLPKQALELLKEQEEQIERLEHDLDVAQNNLHYYVNGND